jgi:hypothetical protein
MVGILATSTIKMCPAGGTDPQDRGRVALTARATLLRPSGTSSKEGHVDPFDLASAFRTNQLCQEREG